MDKYFKNFSIIWLAGVIMFSIIVLLVNILTPAVLTATFWISYVLVLAAFAIQFAAAFKFFNSDSKEKIFLNIPLMTISKSCVIVSTVVGTILMVIPGIPYFIAAIVAAAIILFNIVALVNASTAADAVEEVGKKVEIQTSYIKNMTVSAQNAIASARTEEGKAVANKVYEAFRYSNKSSHGGLDEIESKISANFTVFTDAIESGDDELAKSIGNQLITLIDSRNNMAKSTK